MSRPIGFGPAPKRRHKPLALTAATAAAIAVGLGVALLRLLDALLLPPTLALPGPRLLLAAAPEPMPVELTPAPWSDPALAARTVHQLRSLARSRGIRRIGSQPVSHARRAQLVSALEAAHWREEPTDG
ncbi:hypothetical protein EVJ50_03875 [Synechococcus sp. RSCCF101]|uniref:hypothetical protein n=1 Tax=Synechococcus sp. RSCCF101 TaxID=2511069 RepID=UPI0012460BDD|nr:hypothetical protein [Synechococcus sp. RSCCF101]QEY31515.1 hypothetical protein EVJ50_03875 [Synechococcus sp. RSCCF101]